jgi:hypothetical protein
VLSHGAGGVLLGANCDPTYYAADTLGSWMGFCSPYTERTWPTFTDFSVEDAYKRDVAFDYMRDHWQRLPVVAAARIGRTWGVYRPFMGIATDGTVRPRWVVTSAYVVYWLLVPLAIAGAFVARRRRVPLWPLGAVVATVVTTVAVFHGNLRYRAPAEVVIVVLAAIAVRAVIDALGPRSVRAGEAHLETGAVRR